MNVVPRIHGSVLAIVLAVGAAARSAPAQEPLEPADSVSAKDEGSTLIPLPIVFYQPETGLGFGASAILYYRMKAADDAGPRSSLAPIAIYTTKKQVILAVWSEMYLSRDRWRISSELSYSNFPTSFWGLGNEAPDDAEEDYTPRTFTLRAWPQKRIASGWYAGFALTLIDRKLTEVEPDGLLESGAVPGTKDGTILGLGGSLVRDTRSSTVYPRRGAYHQLLVDLFPRVWLGDYRFGRYSLDLRGYVPVTDSHVLSLQALAISTTGDPPFDRHPELGGDRLLRGYFQGRYRDRNLLALQAEYRLPLFWRVGAAGFVGFGQVAPELAGFGIDRFHLSGGGGFRFLLARDEGLNLRADFAFGENASGFYFSLGEAF